MADFVITDLLEEALLKCGFDPTLMVKYVDNILVIMPEDELENLSNILNVENKSIQFSHELECDKNYHIWISCCKRHMTTELTLNTTRNQPQTFKFPIRTPTNPKNQHGVWHSLKNPQQSIEPHRYRKSTKS